jgi:hypothetical protein
VCTFISGDYAKSSSGAVEMAEKVKKNKKMILSGVMILYTL